MRLVASLRSNEFGKSEFTYKSGSEIQLYDILNAGARNDKDALSSIVQQAAHAEEIDPDYIFLIDWLSLWTFGPSWQSPLPRVVPSIQAWQAEAVWMHKRRSLACSFIRDHTGEVEISDEPGPVKITASINGESGTFILDSGAPTSIVTPTFARIAKLQQSGEQRVVYDGAGIASSMCTAKANEIEIGNWTGKNCCIDILKLNDELPVAGIFSPFELFHGLSITYELNQNRLRIGSTPDDVQFLSCQPLYWAEGAASVKVCVQDKPLFALIDSGAGGFVMMQDSADQVGLTKNSRKNLQSATAFGSVSIADFHVTTIKIPALETFEDRVYVKPRPTERIRPLPRLVDCYLGTSWLKKHIVHFPAKRNVIEVAPVSDIRI